jgi:NDP-sugar pyrophosphorylase family protein
MNKPVLVIMAAGMGSRYGGLKQIDPISDQGEIILDFSLYDAYMAGFEKAIFIIKRENEEDFRALVDERAGKHMEVAYAFQELTDLPSGYQVPEGRVKPWGTCHAVLSARHLIDGPFAVINADDYYGPGAFQTMYNYLETAADDDKYRYCMVGYQLPNTLTENGHVARGVCSVNEAGQLADIVERTKIMRRDGVIQFTEDDGETWITLPEDTTVSMNFWGFTPDIFDHLDEAMAKFKETELPANPLKAECYLPNVVGTILKEGKATVKVCECPDKWFGVTYKEDTPTIVEALQRLTDEGRYPSPIWG